jgi:hypothetical protein
MKHRALAYARATAPTSDCLVMALRLPLSSLVNETITGSNYN